MTIKYHHVFRNDLGFLEVQVDTYPNVVKFNFINQEYCDNGKWLMIECFTGEKFSISVKDDDEFEVVGE